ERIAVVRFPSGQAVQLSLASSIEDAAAGPEFQRLVESVQPADAVAFELGSEGIAPARRVGLVRLAVDPAMTGPTALQFASADGDVSREPAVESATAAAFAAPRPGLRTAPHPPGA